MQKQLICRGENKGRGQKLAFTVVTVVSGRPLRSSNWYYVSSVVVVFNAYTVAER